MYLVAVMDWFSRRVLAWRLSITMDADFCVEALKEAMQRHGKPGIFNTDQGVQFTAAAFIEQLETQGIQVSMDGKGRFLDNIFIERLNERKHQALIYRTPRDIFDYYIGCVDVDNARALPTSTQQSQPQQKRMSAQS